MLVDKKPIGISSFPSITKEIFSFICECLQEFKDRYSNIKPEKGLTQKLQFLLDNKVPKDGLIQHIGISHEYSEDVHNGNAPLNDIAIRDKKGIWIDFKKYPDDEAFFVLEAKRLDSSIGKADRNRRKEYIVGYPGKNKKYNNSGGIERFKKEIHGNSFIHVGMIGYIQTDNFDIWRKNVNNWIDEEITSPTSPELTWEAKDKLLVQHKETIYHTYLSQHACLTKDIEMYHIWVDLT